MFRPTPSRRRRGVRVAIGLALAAGAVLASAASASAHVKVSGTDTVRGGYGVLTFRVPTESATASTTEILITFPTSTPIASASIQPVPGWTATVTTEQLAKPITTDDGRVTTAVSKIDWKADSAGHGIEPGQFQEFAVSAGPLPDAATVAFPTLQTYSDGTTVNWNETSSGSAEPEHPAPVLALAASSDGTGPTVAATAATADPSSAATAGLAVGIIGIVVAVIALVVAVVAVLRGSKRREA
ncbi:YcnI family protein [Amnibacterium kyonggiense]